jgi:membrane associated rhomboid family serine protease
VIEELKLKFQQGNAIIKIILINVGVYLLFALLGVVLYLFNRAGIQSGWLEYLMLPSSLSKFILQPWSLISYMFLHEGFMHLLFNMLWLYWMGNLFQQYLGNSKTFQAYFLGGIFGGLIYMLAYNIFPAFSNMVDSSRALGASAGVLSVVVATATLLPEYQVVLFLLGPVRLKYIALFSVLLDLISIPNGNAGGHIAHLGGAAFGYLFIKIIYSKSNFANQLDSFFNAIGNLFVAKPKLKIHHKANNSRMRVDNGNAKPSQQEIDQILEKISKNGYESLSKKEKEILFKASKD